MTNLEKRDLAHNEAFAVHSKILKAYEAGDFEEALKLNKLYEKLTENAIMWEQRQLN